MKRLVPLIFILLGLPNLAIGQDKRIDQLEILYSQNYYTKVLKKANKLLAIPDYDYSGMPSFYKSLALFRLSENEEWTRKRKNTLSLAIDTYKSFLTFSKAEAYTKSHYYEIAELKQYLIDLQSKLNKKNAAILKDFIGNELSKVPVYGIENSRIITSTKKEKKTTKVKNTEPASEPNSEDRRILASEAKMREDIVNYAKEYIGTPYVWAGTTPKGFDCSGYIGYVYNNHGISTPRSASAQKQFAERINEKEAQKGDLVFFKTGNKITHVGIVISNPGESLTMIHSSSSKGIITTDVHKSSYWNSKYAGVGSIITRK
ncbi:MAG: C40 family peptidase [Crocinitomicaceae bacterium]